MNADPKRLYRFVNDCQIIEENKRDAPRGASFVPRAALRGTQPPRKTKSRRERIHNRRKSRQESTKSRDEHRQSGLNNIAAAVSTVHSHRKPSACSRAPETPRAKPTNRNKHVHQVVSARKRILDTSLYFRKEGVVSKAKQDRPNPLVP